MKTPFWHDDHLTLYGGDCREVLRELPAESVHCVVTSPPYWGLRDYGIGEGGLGLEATPEEFVTNMVAVFREVKRVLRKDGTLWLNLGDAFTDKQLQGTPWRVAFALQADGWYLRSDIIWSKPNPMPESVTDRPTKAHEYLFLLTRSPRYYYDAEAVREPHEAPREIGRLVPTNAQHVPSKRPVNDRRAMPNPAGRNLRSVWSIATEPYPGAHFATFPRKLVEPCVKAGTSERGVCPECGAPWVRESIASYDAQGRTTNGPRSTERRHESPGREVRMVKSVETTGWRPVCAHYPSTSDWPSLPTRAPDEDEAEYRTRLFPVLAVRDALLLLWEPLPSVPAVCLDPFAGSGTTLFVAQALGRRGVGIDLSPDYLKQALERNRQTPLGLVG